MKATLRFLAWPRGATLPSHLCKYSAGRINRIFMKETKIKECFPTLGGSLGVFLNADSLALSQTQ